MVNNHEEIPTLHSPRVGSTFAPRATPVCGTPGSAASAVPALVVVPGLAQRQPANRPVLLPSRGTHGAIAAGSEYATGAGMRMYYSGGNAVDAGIASMLAASVTEFSHFGFGGEAPIL